VTAIASWLIIARAFKNRIGPNDQVIPLPTRELLAISMPMLTTTSLFYLTAQSGVIILGIFHPQAQIGYYSLAVKLSALVGFILERRQRHGRPAIFRAVSCRQDR